MCAAEISGDKEGGGEAAQVPQAGPASAAIQHTYTQKPRPKHKREVRWPIYLAIAAAVVLYISLQDRFKFGPDVPNWIVPLLITLLALPLVIIVPEEYGHWPAWRRILGIVITAVLSLEAV